MTNLIWNNQKTPSSKHFDDVYYNKEDGLQEKQYVFLQGNNLPERFSYLEDDFYILELGFGTGLSFLLTVNEFIKYNKTYKLKFVSTEMFPLTYEEIVKALKVWENLYNLNITQEFLEQYKNADLTKDIIINIENIELKILIGDANKTLKNITTKQDCFYLDGFNPAKNPELWSEEIFNIIKRLKKTNSTASTYSASRLVKDRLLLAGFDYTKKKGFGKKRDMLTAFVKVC